MLPQFAKKRFPNSNFKISLFCFAILDGFWTDLELTNRQNIDNKSSRHNKNTKNEKALKTTVFTVYFEGPDKQKNQFVDLFSKKNPLENRIGILLLFKIDFAQFWLDFKRKLGMFLA